MNAANELQYNLVFEAPVEVFVWQNNWVEYDHLRWYSHITTKNGDWWCEFSISEECFTVYFCIGVIWIWVTGSSFNSGPLANSAVPPHYTVQHTTVILKEPYENGIRSVSIINPLKQVDIINKTWSVSYDQGKNSHFSIYFLTEELANSFQTIICHKGKVGH